MISTLRTLGSCGDMEMMHDAFIMAGVRSELFNSIDLEVCGVATRSQKTQQLRHMQLSTQHSTSSQHSQHSALSIQALSLSHLALSAQHSSAQRSAWRL
jgi:hypothetical protein